VILIACQAPPLLIARASSAQRDEVRHFAAMSGLAVWFGAQVARVEVTDVPVRALAEIAVENAVEGCVRETWARRSRPIKGKRRATARCGAR
jgi:hypothetical protein